MDDPGAVVQLNMGEGKTRVILPMLALHWADGQHIVGACVCLVYNATLTTCPSHALQAACMWSFLFGCFHAPWLASTAEILNSSTMVLSLAASQAQLPCHAQVLSIKQ
jgi:hypothetical protein